MSPNNASLICLNDTSRFGFEPKRLSLVYVFKEHHAGLSAGWLPINLRVRCYTSMGGRFAVQTGGASRDRTDDPLLAKQVLSQLSYGPISRWNFKFARTVRSKRAFLKSPAMDGRVLVDGSTSQ